jgi:hypothetical protein
MGIFMYSSIIKILLCLITLPALGQDLQAPQTLSPPSTLYPGLATGTKIIDFIGIMTSNSNATYTSAAPQISVTPIRKQLGNFGTGCNSTPAITPLNSPPVYNGQLYATSVIRTAAVAAGCAFEGIPTVTASGTGILPVDNGLGAGGTDSATVIVDTYGATTYASYCTSDSHSTDPSYISGINLPGCSVSSGATFSSVANSAAPNVSMLWPSSWKTNSLVVDLSTGYIDSFYWKIDTGAVPRNFETDTNLNSSATAYAKNQGGYYGWGLDYSFTVNMYRACPQGCSAWINLKFCPVPSGGCITTLPITIGDVYHTVVYGTRGIGVSYNSYCYTAITVYDVSASASPITYTVTDTSNNPVCGIPVNNPTWDHGADTQVQFDQSVTGTATAHIDSRITMFYH